MFKMNSKPLFTHDCDGCLFLGNPHDDFYDVYLCPGCDGGTIVVRHGNEDSDYYSSPISIALRSGMTSEPSKLYHKVAHHLLQESMISISINKDVMKEKEKIWFDRWEMRKED